MSKKIVLNLSRILERKGRKKMKIIRKNHEAKKKEPQTESVK
jgi:hypothetical protein